MRLKRYFNTRQSPAEIVARARRSIPCPPPRPTIRARIARSALGTTSRAIASKRCAENFQTVTHPSRCGESPLKTDAPIAFAHNQDALGALAIDIRANIALARRVLPRDVGEASATVVKTLAETCARDAERATTVLVVDHRRERDAVDDARASCALVDGLPSGVAVRRVEGGLREDARSTTADAVVVVTTVETASEERLEETLKRACACVGVASVFVVVDGCEVSKSLMDAASRVGMASTAVESLESTALFERVADGSTATAEEFSTLAWAEASMSERRWVQNFARFAQDIVKSRFEAVLETYQPLRDIVTFWNVVMGESSEFERSGASVAANHMLGKIICGACVGVPNVGILGAAALAAHHREVNPELEVSKLKKSLIYADASKSFAAGTVLSIGGPLTAPLTMLPQLVMYFTIRMRLCMAIAIMGREDDDIAVLRPSLIAAALLCFFGSNAVDVMSSRPTVEQFELEDLMNDLETADAFRGAEAEDLLDDDDKPVKSLGEILNEKLTRLGDDAKERTNEAIRTVLESGSRAERSAQRDAAGASERIRVFVKAQGGSPGEANRAAEEAFAKALPVSLYERMSEGVFTADNLPILVAELVPAVSSYLTIRAATTAMTCMLPESVAAAEQIAREAESEDQETVEQAPETWDESAKKTLVAAGESTKRAAVAVGEATQNAFSEINRSLSRMFSRSSKEG